MMFHMEKTRVDPLNGDLGRVVRAERERLGLTQQQVAEAVQAAGFPLSRATLAKTETGSRSVAVDELVHIADALGSDVLAIIRQARMVGGWNQDITALVRSYRRAFESSQDAVRRRNVVQQELEDAEHWFAAVTESLIARADELDPEERKSLGIA